MDVISILGIGMLVSSLVSIMEIPSSVPTNSEPFFENWKAFRESSAGPERLWLLTTKATQAHWDVSYQDGDGLLFGKETAGAPQWLHNEVGDDQRIVIPRFDDTLRSLNLATSVGIATYEALRQTRAP